MAAVFHVMANYQAAISIPDSIVLLAVEERGGERFNN